MRIINAHNKHQGHGGSEVVFEFVTRLLRQHGHEVMEMSRDNAEIGGLGPKLKAAASMIWSRKSAADINHLIDEFKPDVVHFHNIYPQLSPSVIHACRKRGVPVVVHIHDYKFTCPTAQHLRNGQPCEKCLTGHAYWAAVHNCRGSHAMSIAYALRNISAAVLGTLDRDTTFFLPCSNFVGELLIRGGFDKNKIRVLHNCSELLDHGVTGLRPVIEHGSETPAANETPATSETRSTDSNSTDSYIAYVGRVSPEKGIDNLIEVARKVPEVPIRIAGEIDKMPGLKERAPTNVTFVGKLSRAEVAEFLNHARAVVVPSIWYEAFGLVAVEAMGRRLPVVASRMGGLQEIVDDGVNGYLIAPHDIDAWARALSGLWTDPARARRMGEAGREKVLQKFSPGVYHQRLISIYEEAIHKGASTS